MTKKIRNRITTKQILYIILPLVIITAVLSYYQLFYKSKRVESGLVQPGTVFIAHTAQLRGVRFDPAGEFVVSGSVDSTVRIWKKENGEVIRTLKHPAGVSSIDISDDGKSIVTGSYDRIVRTWRISDGILLKEFPGHQSTVWSVAFSPDKKYIASSDEDGVVNVWDIDGVKALHTLRDHKRTIWSVKFSPDGSKIATASYDASIKLWSVTDGKLLKTIEGHTEAIVDIAFSNSGSMLASTSDDKTIRLWSMPDGKLIRTLKVPEHIQAVVFSPDDKHLLTAGRDKPMIGEFLQEIFGDSEFNKGVSMRLWNVETGELLQTFSEHSNDVNDVAWSKDGLWMASASDDKTVRIWRIEQ